MAENPKDGFDVFVSYAVAENEIPSGAPEGWVSAFVRTLRQELGKTRLGKRVGVSIWWDEKSLDRTEDIQQQLLGILPGVRVVVILLSPSYLESKWCRQEREAFLAAVRDRPLGDKRLFVLDLGRVTKDERPGELQPMLGFKFHDEEGVKFGHPYPNAKWESHSAFFKAMLTISAQIAERLEQIEPGPVQDEESRNGEPVATVYLAETTENLDELRQEMARDLKQHCLRVVPERRLSSELEPCRQQILQAMAQAKPRIFVQLLEPRLGKAFDASAETIVTLQHQLALEQQMTVLQWRGPDVDVGKVTQPVLRSLLTHPYVSPEPLEIFKAEVRRKATPPPEPVLDDSLPADPSRPKIYVQSDVVDDLGAKEIAKLLAQRCGVVSRHPRRSNDPAKNAKYREDTKAWLLDVCDGVVILYGKVTADWVDDQLDEIMKLKARRSRPLRLEAIYIGPPREKDDPSIFDPEVKSIDARLSDEINVDALEPLIRPLFTSMGR
jgi:TIR domain